MRTIARVILIIGFVILPLPLLYAQQPTDTPAAPQNDKLVIRVWWPDSLYALENQATVQVLEDQIDAFNHDNPQYEVSLRLKKHDGQGSTLTTLIAAQPVAASAMPDLVILHQNDLVQAARGGVIRPIDDWAPDTLRADLLPSTLELGIVDGKLYGLPYAVTLQHILYQTSFFEEMPLSFAAILESKGRFLLPGLPAANQEASDIILAQYLSAGGRLVDGAGVPTIDQEALLEILDFYAQGVQAGTFGEEILTYTQPIDYWIRLSQGEVPLALVNSTTYLQNPTGTKDLTYSPLPTFDGRGLVVVEGWLWALTATETEQQDGTLAFMQWMMNAEGQADYTQSLGVLPSRRRALRIWAENDYIAHVEDWLSKSIIIPASLRNNLAAAQIQAAFQAVLSGISAEEATNQALAGLSSSN